jgi:hypothetical protein
MKIAGDYILIESIDVLKNRSAFDNERDIFVNYLGIFHDVNSISYPHVFECHKNCDRGCVDEYFPVSKDEMIFAVKKKIERWMSDIESGEALLKTLEDM